MAQFLHAILGQQNAELRSLSNTSHHTIEISNKESVAVDTIFYLRQFAC